jgi:hypothetical protein
LGKSLNIKLPGALTSERILKLSIENGDKDTYFPAMRKHLDKI